MTETNKLTTLKQLESCARASKDYTDSKINIITFTKDNGVYIPNKTATEFLNMVSAAGQGVPLLVYIHESAYQHYLLPFIRGDQGGVYQFASASAETIYENPDSIVTLRAIVQVNNNNLSMSNLRRKLFNVNTTQLRADIDYLAMSLGITLGGGNN